MIDPVFVSDGILSNLVSTGVPKVMEPLGLGNLMAGLGDATGLGLVLVGDSRSDCVR